MNARLIAALFVALAAAEPVLAADCPQDRAVYTERNNGYELRFRTPDPREVPSNFDAVLTLAFPDGTTVWGTTWMPNGTSWNRAALHSGCKLPGPLDEASGDPLPGSSPEELEACRVWDGVVYALTDGDVDYLPIARMPRRRPSCSRSRPHHPLFRLVAGPGDEPHDVFTLAGCAEP